MPAIVCQDVLAAVLYAGCEPIFCDVDPQSGCVADSEWAKARAKGATAAVLVHAYGNVASVQPARQAFPFGSALLIEDVAQAIGARIDGRPAGTGGDIGLLSFGSTKHIDAGGGGAVLVRRPDLLAAIEDILPTLPVWSGERYAAALLEFRTFFYAARRNMVVGGSASRGSFANLLTPAVGIAAAEFTDHKALAACESLGNLESMAARRRALANAWGSALAGTSAVPVGMTDSSVPWRYCFRLPGIDFSEQDAVAQRLRQLGLQVSNWYLPCYWLTDPGSAPCYTAERFAAEVFQFWCDNSVSIASIDDITPSLRSIIGGH